MISLVLIVAGLFIKAFSIWLKLQDSTVKSENVRTEKKDLKDQEKVTFSSEI